MQVATDPRLWMLLHYKRSILTMVFVAELHAAGVWRELVPKAQRHTFRTCTLQPCLDAATAVRSRRFSMQAEFHTCTTSHLDTIARAQLHLSKFMFMVFGLRYICTPAPFHSRSS